MYSMSDTASISRSTDASDYGVGESFQTVNGINQTAVFVSKSLTSAQLRLSIIQKVAHGIYYSCMYVESISKDRPFTIKTDHHNV